MIPVSYNGEDLYLWPHRHDWEGRARMEVELPAVRTVSLGRRETRRPLGASFRIRGARVSVEISGAEVAAFRRAAIERGRTRIAFPLWHLEQPQAAFASSPVYGGINISYQVGQRYEPDWDQPWEIHEGRTPLTLTVTSRTWTSPLAIGFIKDPGPQAETDEHDEVNLEFDEDSPAAYALQADEQQWQYGPPLPDGFVPPMFPFYDSGRTSISTTLGIDLEREPIGESRESIVLWRGAPGMRAASMRIDLDGVDEIAQLLRFFGDQGGMCGVFWLPSGSALCRLTSSTSAVSSIIEVDSTDNVSVGDYIVIAYRSGLDLAFKPRKVTAKTETTITLDATPGAIDYRRAAVWRLDLVRFDRMRLRLDFDVACSATATVQFAEVPHEINLPDGETRGVTIGALPAKAILYEFAMSVDGVEQAWRYTAWESDLEYNGHTWTAAKISHGDITQTFDLEDDGVEIEMESIAGGPLRVKAQLADAAQMEVICRKGSIVEGAYVDERVLFRGVVPAPTAKNGRLIVEVVPMGWLDEPFPSWRFGRICGHGLFTTGCTLSEDDWRFDGLVTAVTGRTITIGSLTRYNGQDMPSIDEHFFPMGRAEVAASGRRIDNASAWDGSSISIETQPFSTPPAVGTAVKLYPACDGRHMTCRLKFATDIITTTVSAAEIVDPEFLGLDNAFEAAFVFLGRMLKVIVGRMGEIDYLTMITLPITGYAADALAGRSARVGGELYIVSKSDASAGGSTVIYLLEDLDPLPAPGAVIELVKGNEDNWGGALVAAANLSLVKVSSSIGGGKK